METLIIVLAAQMALFTALCCTGIGLNGVLLLVFGKHPEIRTPENLLLINLCISDFVYLLSFGIFIPADLGGSDPVCFVVLFCRSFLVALNAYSVVAISIERYLGLRSFRSRLPEDKTDYRNSMLIIAAVWVTAALSAAMEVLILNLEEGHLHCLSFVFFGQPIFRLLMYAAIPSVMTAVFYVAASCTVRHSVLRLTDVETNPTLEALRVSRRRSARILFALAVTFVLTYLPYYGYLCLAKIYPEITGEVSVLFLTYLMSILNPIFNVIALCIASAQLRQLYKTHCCCCCYRKPLVSTNKPESELPGST